MGETGYEACKRSSLRGWNTWHAGSMAAHVHLPNGAAVLLGLKEYATGQTLREALVSNGWRAEKVLAGPRDYAARYTSLTIEWKGIRVMVESIAEGDEWTALVTPMSHHLAAPLLVAEGAILWNRPGTVLLDGEKLKFGDQMGVITTGELVDDPYVGCTGPYLAVRLDRPVVLSTRTIDASTARQLLDARRNELADEWAQYGENADLAEAMHTCLAWDTVYDPKHDRVVSPVSRTWAVGHGGYVLFCWDTFFAGWMASDRNPDLAAANALEMLNEATDDGFVPNYAYATGQRSRDRSQPPVGSMAVRAIYESTGMRWLLEEAFDKLLRWNRWWPRTRDWDGLLCWGSNPYEPTHGNDWETRGVGETFGGALESGLDNSPMYDGVPFNRERGLMALADVGLNGLYVADCEALAEIARVLGRPEQAELEERRDRYASNLDRLWDEDSGIYKNLRMDTGEFSNRLSPTNFYPLIARVPSETQAERMVHEHLTNPAEFWGEFTIPSISRSDPAFADQEYWRGRIWAPMNFLVYLGLRRYPFTDVRREFVEKSARLLLNEWRNERHIHENYNADTGDGDDVGSSDPFYHWGALLALMALMESRG